MCLRGEVAPSAGPWAAGGWGWCRWQAGLPGCPDFHFVGMLQNRCSQALFLLGDTGITPHPALCWLPAVVGTSLPSTWGNILASTWSWLGLPPGLPGCVALRAWEQGGPGPHPGAGLPTGLPVPTPTRTHFPLGLLPSCLWPFKAQGRKPLPIMAINAE